MSSSGGGIVVHPFGNPADKCTFTKDEAQAIVNCLLANGFTDFAEKLQPIVNDAS